MMLCSKRSGPIRHRATHKVPNRPTQCLRGVNAGPATFGRRPMSSYSHLLQQALDEHQKQRDSKTSATTFAHYEKFHASLNYIYGHSSNVVRHLKLARELDSDILKNVVNDMMLRHPLLGVDIIPAPVIGGAYRKALVPNIAINVKPRTGDMNEEIASEMNSPIMEGSWRVTMLPSTGGVPETDLLVTLNHTIADAQAAITLTSEILDRYIDYEERVDKLPPQPLASLQEPPQIQPVTGLSQWIESMKLGYTSTVEETKLKPLAVQKSKLGINPLQPCLKDHKSKHISVSFADPKTLPSAVRAVLLEAIKESMFSGAKDSSASLQLANVFDLRKFAKLTDTTSPIRNYSAPIPHIWTLPNSTANALSTVAMQMDKQFKTTETRGELLWNRYCHTLKAQSWISPSIGNLQIIQPVATFRTVPSFVPAPELVEHFNIRAANVAFTSKLPMFEAVFGEHGDSSKLSLTYAAIDPWTDEAVSRVAARVAELTPAVTQAIRIQSESI